MEPRRGYRGYARIFFNQVAKPPDLDAAPLTEERGASFSLILSRNLPVGGRLLLASSALILLPRSSILYGKGRGSGDRA